ncbi:MAG: CHAP domain-containing protein [Methanobrevibacter sp.]|nr:CHAP domain-containing protein [Methanobrevibacter sp.]
MAKYTGYVTLPIESYTNWKNAVNGNGYDVDSSYGCQCWDLASEFWWNVGFPQNYPIITSSSAYTMWENRQQNIGYNGTIYFDLITSVNDIQLGDIVVFNYNSTNPYGHVGFADTNYSSWTPDPSQPYEFPVLSENNGGTPDPSGGAYTNVHGYDIRLFLGAFRYREWHTTPPTPPSQSKSKFPFVLYARRLRNKQQGL